MCERDKNILIRFDSKNEMKQEAQPWLTNRPTLVHADVVLFS